MIALRSPLSTFVLRTTYICLLCSRPLAEEQGGRFRVLHPEHADAVRVGRCPHCGGNVVASDVETVAIRPPLPAEDDAPRRGRPPRPMPIREVAP